MKKRQMHAWVLPVLTAALVMGSVGTLPQSLSPSASTVEEAAEYNVLKQSLNVTYDIPLETQDWQLNGQYKITSSGNKIGNWGGYDGWTALVDGGIRYDYQGVENGPSRISRFYTMISNFTKGLAKISLTVDKLQAGESLDLTVCFWDVVSSKQVGFTDFTEAYNALDVGNGQTISLYTDLTYIGSLDSMIVSTKADTAEVQFAITDIDVEWGVTEIATADGYFRGLENGFNVVFDKLTRKNTTKNYDMMPLTGFSTDFGAYDSGRHGDYGFNKGAITAHNDEDGEYLRFGQGDNNCAGIWLKFPLDLTTGTLDLSVTLMKEVVGDCQEVKFEFMGKDGVGTKAVILSNAQGLPEGGGLSSVPAGEWVTYHFEDVDLSGMTSGFDSLGIWVECTGAEDQAIRLKNVAMYYDECGADRTHALSDTDKTVSGMTFASAEGVAVKSDYTAKEYVELDLAQAEGEITANYSVGNLPDGKYKAVVSLMKTEEVGNAFAFDLITQKGNAAVSEYALKTAIASANVGEWTTVETQEFEVKNGSVDAIAIACEGTETVLLEYVSLVATQEYIQKDSSFGVANVLTRDFTALNNMGMDEYDFSQNGFPEIGNWSDSFPDLRSQGQKVVRDEDGTPVMQIYRRTNTEIEVAKAMYNWPAGTYYVPADKSHFFVTAPVSAGYFTLEITAKKGENFQGTSEFSLEGYMGSEPWWKLANFTQELAEAEVGEWVTYSADIYLPKAIDSIKILVETRFENSDLFIKDVNVISKSQQASGNYVATSAGDLTWDLITDGTQITSVTCGEKALSASDYSLNNDAFTLKKEYLSTLPNGTFDVVLASATEEITLTVYVSKVAPVVNEENFVVNIARLPEKTELSVDCKDSGISYIELNERELEEDVDYAYDQASGTLTLFESAFSELTEEGEATLVIATRAGTTTFTFQVENKDNAGLIIGLSVGGVALVGGGVAAIVLLKKKRK